MPDVPVGATFPDRRALSQSGVHRPTQPGICGSNDGEGAESIVLSGGYADDRFEGDRLVYTGQGGRHPGENRQVTDQPWNGYNASLARSILTGRPVRVARLVHGGGLRAYRYEGLFRVTDYWKERGQDGFFVWQFLLVRLAPDDAAAWGETWTDSPPLALEYGGLPPSLLTDVPADLFAGTGAGLGAAPRTLVLAERIVRDTAAVRRVKRLHDFRCQVCAVRLDTPAGPYAEGAHVRPLGHPHDGPDVLENLLCLCPNCHVRFDAGGLGVWDDGRLIGMQGRLRTVPGHVLEPAHLAYHRTHRFNAWPSGTDG